MLRLGCLGDRSSGSRSESVQVTALAPDRDVVLRATAVMRRSALARIGEGAGRCTDSIAPESRVRDVRALEAVRRDAIAWPSAELEETRRRRGVDGRRSPESEHLRSASGSSSCQRVRDLEPGASSPQRARRAREDGGSLARHTLAQAMRDLGQHVALQRARVQRWRRTSGKKRRTAAARPACSSAITSSTPLRLHWSCSSERVRPEVSSDSSGPSVMARSRR